ncbi:aromatic prenyltransferase [Aspergillus transmontanensis]|uniref:Aromatic prenyltransferase n=1 Tax=Aspergillus transmontanensis TaxID=1034304 RepID=A0A5N6W6D5_9EURO|nr:aromatic prenyltransferase [Aspergillus transmontanensis]
MTVSDLTSAPCSDPDYWWYTIGQNLKSALSAAGYQEDVRESFLGHFRETVCPSMGGRMYSRGPKSTICPDGSPFHCSFELKESTDDILVRCSLDLRTGHWTAKLGEQYQDATQLLVAQLAPRMLHSDSRWFDSLSKSLGNTHLSDEDRQNLFSTSASRDTTVVGFDVKRTMGGTLHLPANMKVAHFAAHTAIKDGISKWDALQASIKGLPDIETYPNFLRSFKVLEDYIESKHEAFKDGALALSTDILVPSQARLKLYLFSPSDNFDNLWDYYTLGGQIPGLETDRKKFEELMVLFYGTTSPDIVGQGYEIPRLCHKRTLMYFSLCAHRPYPDPKIYFYVPDSRFCDEVYIKGLDRWLETNGWDVGHQTLEDRVKACFKHRPLSQGAGIFLCIGLGRKGNDVDGDLSMQVYLTPELGEPPVY